MNLRGATQETFVEASEYEFKFSKLKDVSSPSSCCRIVIIFLLTLSSFVLPVILLLSTLDAVPFYVEIPYYAWFGYLLVFHSIVLIFGGVYSRTFAYPLSNAIFGNSIIRQSNLRYANEFRRCIDRMTHMIRDMVETQSYERASSILAGQED